MTLLVNGEPREVPGPLSALALLQELGIRGGTVAVEVNRAVIPRGALATTELSEGDCVEIVTLVGGG